MRAAGGVIVRIIEDERHVLLVHRPRYDDWTFPKGKVEPGESDEACALREVEEEASVRCRLGRELPSTRYRDRKGRPKTVRWWLMTTDREPAPANEVDEVRWVTVPEARGLLTWPRDAELLGEL